MRAQEFINERKKRSKKTRGTGGYFFPGYGYYGGSGDSGDGGGDGGGGESRSGITEGKRVARKPGQPAGSKKHSDLYTDENPRGTITGLKFATVEDARASVSKIRSSGRSHAHKIQAAVAMEQRARAAGKASAAAVYRKYINANKKTSKTEGVAEGSLKESAVFLNPTTVIVGQAHGQPLELSPDTLKKIQDIAAKHGAWYEGNGTDRSYTKGQIDRYIGSWDDEVAKTASANDPKWLYVLFANVDENNRVKRVGVDPKDTIFNRLMDSAQDNSFQGIGYTAQALQQFLQMASEGQYDFVKMSQQPATQENLTRFLKTGEALMWPSNWEQYPNRAGKIAKAATVDVRDQYLATRKAGVYVTGSGHLKAVQNITGKQGVAEGLTEYKNTPLQDYNGLQFMIDSNHPYLRVKAFAPGSGQQLAQVDFKIDDQDELHPEDLHVEERWRGQGIAQTMYDFVKSKGYTIHRSWSQTDAGAGFWDKHRGEERVWEQGVAEGLESLDDKIKMYAKYKSKAQNAENRGDYTTADKHKKQASRIYSNIVNLHFGDDGKDAQNAANEYIRKSQGMVEGGAETSWSNDTGTITLQDILELTKHIKQINLPINDNLKSKLLHWEGNPEEIERVNQVTVSNQFPILIMVDEQGQIAWILDGNHRLHKAIQSQAKTIPAKLIKPSNLNDKAKKIFNIKEQGVAEGLESLDDLYSAYQHHVELSRKYRKKGNREKDQHHTTQAFNILQQIWEHPDYKLEFTDDPFSSQKNDALSMKHDSRFNEQGVAEEVNPDITSGEKYFSGPTPNVRMGDFIFNASLDSGGYRDPNAKGLKITAYDPKNFRKIGWVDFIVHKDKKGNTWLESDETEVDDRYQRKGVATMMYAYAKSLGNDIKPSDLQSNSGIKMWKKWGSDAAHLVGEQGVAEEVNPEILSTKNSLPTENITMGDYEFNARIYTGELGNPGLQIRAYDPKKPQNQLIGHADFIVLTDKKGNTWLESDATSVNPSHQGKGVAAMMYAFAKSLGNDIKPSDIQEPPGEKMWKKWGKDAKNLVGEQGVAEGFSNAVTFFRGEPILSQERLNQLKSSIGKPYPILRKEGSAANIGTYMSPDGDKATSFVKQALAGQGKGGVVTQIQVNPNSFSKGDGGIDEAVIITNIAGLVSNQTPNKNDPLRIQDRKQAMLKYLGPGVKKYLNDPLLSDPKIVQSWYNPEFAQKNWNTINSGKQAVTKPGESNMQERMMRILGPLAENIRRDPEVISYFISHNPGDWVEYNFRMNSDGSGTKVVDVKYYPPAKQGVAEGLSVDVPNEEWLNDAIEYAKQRGLNSFGVPYMGKTTATVRQVEVPVMLLRRIPGMRKEQQNVRQADLAAIMKIMKDTGKLPLHAHTGEEYKPFINVAYDGSAWVNEGNHRIMAAYRLGFETLPVEISYFDGGERIESGPMYPGKIGL